MAEDKEDHPSPPLSPARGEGFSIKAHSPSPPELFEDIARKLFRLLIDPKDVGAALREKVAVEGESLEHLLHEWVTALMDLVRTQKMVFSQFRVTELKMPEKGPYSLRAEAVGELLDPHRHPLRVEPSRLVRGETHLRKESQIYYAEIVLNK